MRYGYRLEQGRIVEEPKEQAALAVMARMWRQDATAGEIARALARQGYRTRNGRPFSSQAVWQHCRAQDRAGRED